MEHRQALTGREVEVQPRHLIVSRTDPSGRITFVNPDFIEVSGYSEAELIGADYGTVRHPDMPKAVFEDLWRDLAAGRPWSGLIKNRCRNGDHYWVLGSVAPIIENGRITGYISVGRRAPRTRIDQAEADYRRLREEPDCALVVCHGQVVSNSLLARCARRYRDLTLVSKLWWSLGLAMLLVIALAAVGWLGSAAMLTDVLELADTGGGDAARRQAALARMEDIRSLLGAGVLAIAAVCGALVWLVRSTLSRPLAEARRALEKLAAGDFQGEISATRGDELGRLLQALKSMKIRLGYDFEARRREAAENLRIRQALECVETNVRIADIDGRVIYANPALLRTLHRVQAEIRRDLPDFDASRFIGSNIGQLYPDPEAAVRRLANLREQTRIEMQIGGRHFVVTTNPIIDGAGQMLGTVGEWRDRTDELAAEAELTGLVSRAATGDFSGRVLLEGKSGFFLQLAEGLNRLMAVISGSVEEVARVLEAVARGQLTERIAGDYVGTLGRLKDDTNTTVARLLEVVERIKRSAEAISTATRQIAAGNAELSARTEAQAGALEQTASAMEELNATVHQNADNAQVARELAANANTVAERGGATMRQVVATMAEIEHAARRIEDIIGVIDTIAFQTNILAVNAAVEAARAGEAGRGFAVVAAEVRALAKRSAQAAREVKGLIVDSANKVEGGVRLVDEAGRTMEEIVAAFHRVAELVSDIAQASREQSQGIEQVNAAVGQMDEMTQHNAALVEEAAAAAASLDEQARDLVEAVGVFEIGEATNKTPQPPVGPTAAAGSAVVKLTSRSASGAVRTARAAPLPKVRKRVVDNKTMQDDWEAF